MTREDRLDELLEAILHPHLDTQRNGHHRPSTSHQQNGDAALLELVAVTADLKPLAQAQPDPAFAADLHVSLLARAAERRTDLEALGILPQPRATTVAELETAPLGRVPASRRGTSGVSLLTFVLRSAPRVALVAAVLALTLGIGVWGLVMVAANAGPGNPFYGLHQFEHSVQVNTAPNSVMRAQVHLSYARELLTDLRVAATNPPAGTTYAGALTALVQEVSAAAQQIAQVPVGPQRTTLDTALASLHRDEHTTLRGVLPDLGWQDRLITSPVLATLGDSVPQVTSAQVLPASHGQWTVTLSGSGFAPGAILLVNGHPNGVVTAVTPTSLTAQVAAGLVRQGATSLGVGNPDDTAGVITAIQVALPPTPTPTPSATPGGHGHGGTGATGGTGGSGSGTSGGHSP